MEINEPLKMVREMQNLQPHQAGMMIKKETNVELTDFLPLTEVNIDVEINESIAYI